MQKCSKCGNILNENDKFCNKCGNRVSSELICLNCNLSIPADSVYCPNCGIKVNENVSEPLTFEDKEDKLPVYLNADGEPNIDYLMNNPCNFDDIDEVNERIFDGVESYAAKEIFDRDANDLKKYIDEAKEYASKYSDFYQKYIQRKETKKEITTILLIAFIGGFVCFFIANTNNTRLSITQAFGYIGGAALFALLIWLPFSVSYARKYDIDIYNYERGYYLVRNMLYFLGNSLNGAFNLIGIEKSFERKESVDFTMKMFVKENYKDCRKDFEEEIQFFEIYQAKCADLINKNYEKTCQVAKIVDGILPTKYMSSKNLYDMLVIIKDYKPGSYQEALSILINDIKEDEYREQQFEEQRRNNEEMERQAQRQTRALEQQARASEKMANDQAKEAERRRAEDKRKQSNFDRAQAAYKMAANNHTTAVRNGNSNNAAYYQGEMDKAYSDMLKNK